MQEIILTNGQGMEVSIQSYGARIGAVRIPTADEQKVDVVLGYDTPAEYISGDGYQASICGRFANRIAAGKFSLNGVDYALDANSGGNHLHGGPSGFSHQQWELTECSVAGAASACKLSLTSAEGHEGYPGTLQVEAYYSLTEANELLLDMRATTDKTTIVNLTSHPYFNLKGAGNGNALDHVLTINADAFTPLGTNFVPTGEIRPVDGTVMDMRQGRLMQEVADSNYEQLALVGGVDHNWALNIAPGEFGFAGKLEHPATGRSITISTTQPGLQIYGGMHYDGVTIGKSGKVFVPYGGIAIEAQGFPDAPNKPHFPTATLEAADTYSHQILYAFAW
jgi:aldose 1-epimerase